MEGDIVINEELLVNFVQSIKSGHSSGNLYLIIGVVLSITPFAWKLFKKFITTQKTDFKKEIKEDIKEDQKQLTKLMSDQMQSVKDTVEVVKSHSKLSQRHHEDNQTMMMMHIEELRHLHEKVNVHDEEIDKNKKRLNILEK